MIGGNNNNNNNNEALKLKMVKHVERNDRRIGKFFRPLYNS